MDEQLKQYKSQCEDAILSIHGIDLKDAVIDVDRLEDAMESGITPIEVAKQLDPKNYHEEE